MKHIKPSNYREIKRYVDGQMRTNKQAALNEGIALALDEFYTAHPDDTTLCGLALAMNDEDFRTVLITEIILAGPSLHGRIHDLLVRAMELVPAKRSAGVEAVIWANHYSNFPQKEVSRG